MRIVLPGEADAPEDLDALLSVLLVRGERPYRRCGRRQSSLVAIVARAGSVPAERGGELGRDQHGGQVVLDGLEATDGPTELLAYLRIIDCHVQGRPRSAR